VLSGEALTENVPALAEVLLECVRDGASIGFMSDLSVVQAVEYWKKIAARSANSELYLLAAFVDGDLAGTVQLVLSPQPNQPHRAEVSKLLVRPRFRRLGVARELMQQN